MIRTGKILELQQQWFRRVNQQHKNTTSNRQKSLLPGHYSPESRDNQANLFVIEFIQMINVKYAFSKLTTAKKNTFCKEHIVKIVNPQNTLPLPKLQDNVKYTEENKNKFNKSTAVPFFIIPPLALF